MATTLAVFDAFGTTKNRSGASRYAIRSSSTPPWSLRIRLYRARPIGSFEWSLVKVCWRSGKAPGPATSTLPRWLRSNRPTRSRTARCSETVPSYSMGIAHPANAPIFAPRSRWTSSSGVRSRSPECMAASYGCDGGGNMAVRMADAYDVVVIGSGTGGSSCALRSAELGKRVALVERDGRLGGTCLLRGCIPTKALLRSAEVLDTVNRAEEWGVKASGSADWDAVKAFEDRMVDKLVSGL